MSKALSFTGLLIVLALAMGLGGCVSEVSDADIIISDTHTSTDGVGTTDATTNFRKFYYLKVLDMSTETSGQNPGADIDAVRLTKADGVNVFVSSVLDYKPKVGDQLSAVSSLTENVLGEPTAFSAEGEDFTTADSSSRCSLDDSHYLGLGGAGGYVIVQFGAADIVNGDQITVYEIGNCMGNSGSAGFADAVEVQISVGAMIDENWQTVLSFTAGPVMRGTVSGLPLIPIEQ